MLSRQKPHVLFWEDLDNMDGFLAKIQKELLSPMKLDFHLIKHTFEKPGKDTYCFMTGLLLKNNVWTITFGPGRPKPWEPFAPGFPRGPCIPYKSK